MNKFLILTEFVLGQPLILQLDRVEAVFEDNKKTIGISTDSDEMEELYNDLPERYTRVEMVSGSFYPVKESINEIIEYIKG